MATETKELNLVVMNANGPTKKGNAEKRKEGIAKLLKEEKPLLVFMQGFTWKRFSISRVWKGLQVSGCYQYVGHAEAGFVYDRNEITLTRYDENTNVIQMWEKPQKSQKGDFTKHDELPQMCICVIERERDPSFRLLVISWHQTSKKKDVVKLFGEFVVLLKKEYQLPVIVGGDLDATDVRGYLHAYFHVIERPEEREKTKLMILVDKNIMDWHKLEHVTLTDEVQEAFYHVPLKIVSHLSLLKKVTGYTDKEKAGHRRSSTEDLEDDISLLSLKQAPPPIQPLPATDLGRAAGATLHLPVQAVPPSPSPSHLSVQQHIGCDGDNSNTPTTMSSEQNPLETSPA